MVYIATDERDHSYFAPLAAHFELKFFDDFPEVKAQTLTLPKQNLPPGSRFKGDPYKEMFWSPDISGMVEAIIASNSQQFVGTWLSTFSSVIYLLRGFHKHIEHKEVYFSNKQYSGVLQQDARHGTRGEGGAGFHWQEHMNRRWELAE